MDSKKGRLLFLEKYMYEFTDQQHPVSTNDLINILQENSFPANRKTIKDDMDILLASGMDIVTHKSSQNLYYVNNCLFQVSEVKLLAYAIATSKFVSREQSEEITRKLQALVSNHQIPEIIRHLYPTERVKSSNNEIYSTVNTINDAINKNKKICFQYLEYTPSKEKVLKNKGELYINSPYALLWNDDRYYMIGYSEKYRKIVQFRVDRMYRPKISNFDALPKPPEFHIVDYIQKIFEMFPGKEETVILECQNEMMRIIVDKFGESVRTWVSSDSTFQVQTNVCLSPTFYGWIFQFAGQIKIVSPKIACDEYIEMLKKSFTRQEDGATDISE